MSEITQYGGNAQAEDDVHDRGAVASGPIIAFDDLVFACSNLCDLLEIENEALASHDPETVKVLLTNKAALVRLYEKTVQPLIVSPELAETLEPEQRDELLAVGIRLNELISLNEIRLRAEMDAYQRVMSIMVNNAKKRAINGTTYGRAGTFGHNRGNRASLSFNTSL